MHPDFQSQLQTLRGIIFPAPAEIVEDVDLLRVGCDKEGQGTKVHAREGSINGVPHAAGIVSHRYFRPGQEGGSCFKN